MQEISNKVLSIIAKSELVQVDDKDMCQKLKEEAKVAKVEGVDVLDAVALSKKKIQNYLQSL